MGTRNDNQSSFSHSRLTDYLKSRFFLCGVGIALLVWLIDPFIDAVLLHEGTFHQQLMAPGATEIYSRAVLSSLIIIFSFVISLLSTLLKQVRAEPDEIDAVNRNFIMISQDWIWTINLERVTTHSNPAIEKILGYRADELIGNSCLDFIHEDDRRELEKMLSECIAEKKGWQNLLIRWRHKDGSWRYLKSNAVPVLDDAGQLSGFRGVDRDITERKQANEALLMEKQFSETVITSLPGIFYLFDEQEKFLRWNRNLETISGYSNDEIVQMHPLEFFPSEEQPLVQEIIEKEFDKGMSSVEASLLTKDGRTIPYFFTGARIKMDATSCLVGMGIDISERKQAEEALRESESKLREAQQMAHLGHWSWDVKTGDVEWSEEVYIIFRLDPEEFTPQIDSILDLSPWPENHQRDKELIQRAIESRKQGSYEQRFLRPDGSTGYYFSTFQGTYDDSGELIAMRGTVQDITDRKRAEELLSASEERFRDMVNLLPQPIYEADTQGNITFTNRAGLDAFGVIAEDIDGKTHILDFIIPEERERGIGNIQKILRGEMTGPNEYTILRKDGITFPAIVHSSPRIQGGEVTGVRGLVMDITERKQVEEALRKSEEKLYKAFQTTPDGVAISRLSDGMYIYINPGLAKLTRCPAEKIIGQSSLDLDFWAIQEDRKELVKRLEEEGEVSNFETEFRPIDGETFPCSMSASLIEIEGEKYMVSLTRDITERKRAEKELQKLSRAVEQSASMVMITDTDAHIEYVNPKFTEVTGYSQGEVIGRNPKILQSGETPHVYYEEMWATISAGHEWRAEVCNRKKSGELYWASIVTSPIKDANDEITHYLCTQEDITEARHLSEQLTYQASHDALTNLINRREFERRLERVLETTREGETEHALCYLDLDQFKVINDTCGHVAGDELLRQLARSLQQKIRKRDTLARLGGDEFGVLMEHCTLKQARRVAGALRKEIQDFRFVWEDQGFNIGVSMGIVPINKYTGSTMDIFKDADAACYAAKDAGRNRIHVYHPEDEELARRHGEMQWLARINQALGEGRFQLYAQPIVPLGDDTTASHHYELLLRMEEEDGTLILPEVFLPAAERYGLATKLDHWVIETAFKSIMDPSLFQTRPTECFINLSGNSLADPDFLDFVITQLKDSGIYGENICFEITETAAITNLLTASQFIHALKEFGCRFALDDFGSGLSSFAYLKTLAVDYLKIDGMFVKDIVVDRIDHAMVKSINEIGQVMGMETIAECVENDEIKGMLREIGVNYAQGNGIERPHPLDKLKPYK